MIQDVFVIGATGKVGRTLVGQIMKEGDTDPSIHVNPTRIVGLASSTHHVFSPNGLSPQQSDDFVNKQYGYSQEYVSLNDLLEAVSNEHLNDSTLVFVDVTAVYEPMTRFHLKVIETTRHGIVTANKNPIALSDYATFQKLTEDPRRYGYRCSVMAGAHSINFIQERKDLNDLPQIIDGCFSGTLGYITSELEKDRKFSEILREAKEKGYTEPDPRDDLRGLDVARKLIVLARTAGYSLGIENVKVIPFIPQEYFSDEDISDFLIRARELDDYFEERVAHAREKGLVLRYIAGLDATRENPALEVSLQDVPIGSELGNLKGTSNKIVIFTKVYPNESPYVIKAPGAGLEVTAQNIRADLLYLLEGRKNKI